MIVIPYTLYMPIVKGSFYSYNGKTWEALKNYTKAPTPKENTIWREYKAPLPDPRDLEIANLKKKLALKLTSTTKLTYPITLDMIAYIIMQQNGGDGTEPEPIPNLAPTANAGTDKAITLPVNSVVLNGVGADSDGTVSYNWVQAGGPTQASLTNANTANLTATFSQAGTYTFILTVTDNNGAAATDTAVVVVSPAIVVNTPPVADAGPNNTITLPNNSVQLAGTATDADGVPVTYAWSQIIGPNTANISNAAIPNPVISGLIEGTYTFRLTASDGELTDTDDVIITVNAEPVEGEGVPLVAPLAVAKPSGITLPGTTEYPPTLYVDNSPPLALDVRISNHYFNRVGETLNLAFAYYDAENSAPGTHTYKWYKRDKFGTETLITGQTAATYLIPNSLLGYGIKGEITPVSSDGVIGTPVSTMYTDYVVAAAPTYQKATIVFTGVSGAVTSATSITRSSSAANGTGRTTQGFTGKGYVQLKNALPGIFSGTGGGKKPGNYAGQYNQIYGLDFGIQLDLNLMESFETGGRTHTEKGTVFQNAYWRVERDLNVDANGNPIPGTWAIYFSYCPDKNGVYRRVKKSTQTINGTTPIGMDFLISGAYNNGQGFNNLEIAGEGIATL